MKLFKQNSDFATSGHALRNRRKSYYHGKYYRELMSIGILMAVIIVIVRQIH